MATQNSINLTAAGVVTYNGSGAFSASAITQYYPLVGGASNAITSLGAMTDGQIVIGSTGASPVIASLTAGSGITITPGAGSISIAATATGFPWTVIAASQTLAVNNGYFVGTGACALALPAASAVGDVIRVDLRGGTSWSVTQAAGQKIYFGNTSTTAGVGGSLASTAQGDAINMVCSLANTEWVVVSSVGNLTVV